jgi:hypothetical protein
MRSQPSDDFEDIRNRIVVLERQNRRFKQLGAAALIIPVLLLVMGQTPSKKPVEAKEFILRDDSGTIRAKLWMNAALATPEMLLFDENGKPRVQVRGGVGKTGIGGGVSVFDAHGQERGTFAAAAVDPLGGGFLSLVDSKGTPKTILHEGDVTVSDDQGFEATLGAQELVTPRTGETHKTSAASLILFDKDKNIIWKAP